MKMLNKRKPVKKTEIVNICIEERGSDEYNTKIDRAAKVLTEDGLVVFPTETVYGIGANARSNVAVTKIFKAKGRPSDNPLIVHISGVNQLDMVVHPDFLNKYLSEDSLFSRLANAFWPGPLTMVLKKHPVIPAIVTGGLDTVAIRMPGHTVALDLLKAANVPVAAPSANSSGKPSPTKAEHVIDDLCGKVNMIIDGGNCSFGIESTVLDITNETNPVILRPGNITAEMVMEVTGIKVSILDEGRADKNPRSPGLKYRHYAPDAKLFLFEGKSPYVRKAISYAGKYAIEHSLKAAVLSSSENFGFYLKKFHIKEIAGGDIAMGDIAADNDFVDINFKRKYIIVKDIGSIHKPLETANVLYKVLRELDKENVSVILSEAFPGKGVGIAVMNRLYKASGGNIISGELLSSLAGNDLTAISALFDENIIKAKKVLFVCTGNTCRSFMAESIFNNLANRKGLGHKAFSAGLCAFPGEPASEQSIKALFEIFGIDYSGHKAVRLEEKFLEEASLVLTMTLSHKKAILEKYPYHNSKIFTLSEYIYNRNSDIDDPYGRAYEVYRKTALQLYELINSLLLML